MFDEWSRDHLVLAGVLLGLASTMLASMVLGSLWARRDAKKELE